MTATKIDYRKTLRDLYVARREPQLVDVPEMTFLMSDGHGDPNTSPLYTETIQALYAVAYAAKFIVKRSPDGIDFGVLPLEGLWWAPDIATFTQSDDKSEWRWTMMIMQPAPVTLEVIERAKARAAEKLSADAVDRVRVERFVEGRCAQILHAGSYATE